jgi:lipopolysaccharide transport system permease protein
MSELIIEPGRAEKNYWRDLWRYRELFYFLAWRDILVRYKQTIMGIAWSVVRPLLTMVIFTILFSRIAKLHAPAAVPYALLVMAGMLPWQFISGSMTASSESMVQNSNLVSKIYFPRLIVPASSVITSFVDFAITLVLMAIMMAIYRFSPDWRLIALPAFILLAFAASIGAGLWLCALNVEYRDFRYIIPFVVRALCLPRRVQQQCCPRQVAAALFPEPGGGRDRRLSLVAPARSGPHLVAQSGQLHSGHHFPVPQRRLVFPQNGAELC